MSGKHFNNTHTLKRHSTLQISMCILSLMILCIQMPGYAQAIHGERDLLLSRPPSWESMKFPPGSDPPDTPTEFTFQLSGGQVVVEEGPGIGVGIREQLQEGQRSSTMEVGKPDLGLRIVDVLLPYDADLSTVEFQIGGIERQYIGRFPVRPAPQPASYDDESKEWIYPLSDDVQLDEYGRDVNIYDLNRFWPSQSIKMTGTGQIGKYRYVRLLFSPFQWNPSNHRLRKITNVQVYLSWQRKELPGKKVQFELSADFGLAPISYSAFINLGYVFTWYALQNEFTRNVDYDYLIITTRHVTLHSETLFDFVSYKQSIGHRVLTVRVEDINYLYPHSETADNIRAFLQDAYWAWGVTYLLLVGEPDPFDQSEIGDYVGAVPMKMTWLNGSGDDTGAYPTDFYYGELTEDWDADGDGWAAEVEDDGVLEFGAELLVGRIPSEDVETIDTILERTISYEQQSESPPAERSSAVLACSFVDFETDGAYLGEQLLDGPFSDAGLTGRPMYQDDSGFSSWRYLEDGSLPSEWSDEEFGLVVWMGHGNPYETVIGIPDLWIEGELMSTSSVSMLEESAPSFIIQLSCLNAQPEVSYNLAHELIRNQAVSTIAASRISYYLGGKTSFGDNIDIGSIGYFCADNHAGQSPAGVPMSLYRYYLFNGNPGGDNWKVKNLLTFNLYGDPSLAYIFE